MVTYFALLRGPCSDACMKSASAAADEKSQHNVSADRYHSTLMVNTEAESEEQMLHIPQIQYPSPSSHLTKSREMLVPAPHPHHHHHVTGGGSQPDIRQVRR